MTLANAYLTRMPAGFPGMTTRNDQCTLQPEVIDASYPPVLYGIFVKMVSGKIRTLPSGAAAADIVGLIARPYPVQETSTPGGTLGESPVPNTALPCDILKRGYMVVRLVTGTAAKGGQVYVCTVAGGANVVGDIGDSSMGGTVVAVANCFFMGAVDSSNNVEISYNIER